MKTFYQYQSPQTYKKIIERYRAKERAQRMARLGEAIEIIVMAVGIFIIMLFATAFWLGW